MLGQSNELKNYNHLKYKSESEIISDEYCTPAEIAAKVPMKERRDRNEMLRILSEKKKRAFYDSQIGTKRTVIFEEGNVGFTENYVKVIAENAVANSVR